MLLARTKNLIKTFITTIFRKGLFKGPFIRYSIAFVLAFSLFLIKGGSVHEGNSGLIGLLKKSYAYESYELTSDETSMLAQVGTISIADKNNFRPTTLAILDDSSLAADNFTLIDAMTQAGNSGANKIEFYTVKEGDTLSFIADRYDVSTNTIVQANGLRNADSIKPGMDLKILPTDGLLVSVVSGDTVSGLANKYSSDSEKIIAFNDLGPSGDLSIGEELIIPDGVMPISRGATVRKRTSIKSLPAISGYFATPVQGTITQCLHGGNGIDIGAPYGTPVYAAAGGTVIEAKSSGWNYGYGNVVVIQHPNGTATRYAHASSVVVVEGEVVSQGQHIMNIGSTGKSTGPHVHFEVRGARNPLAC